MIRKEQAKWVSGSDVRRQIQFINQLFEVVDETEPGRPNQSFSCCFLKVATHPYLERWCREYNQRWVVEDVALGPSAIPGSLPSAIPDAAFSVPSPYRSLLELSSGRCGRMGSVSELNRELHHRLLPRLPLVWHPLLYPGPCVSRQPSVRWSLGWHYEEPIIVINQRHQPGA